MAICAKEYKGMCVSYSKRLCNPCSPESDISFSVDNILWLKSRWVKFELNKKILSETYEIHVCDIIRCCSAGNIEQIKLGMNKMRLILANI